MSQHFDDEALRVAYEPVLRDSTTIHGPDCPSETALLAAVRGEGPEAERLRVLDHALRCPACRREVALLHAVSGGARVSRSALRTSWSRWVPLALAASLVLVAGVAGVDRWRARDDITRAGVTGVPALVEPPSGNSVDARALRFVWRPVAGALGYTLELDATDGTVLFTTRTTDTAFVAPLTGTPAGEHRWSVRARMDDGSERRSEARVLRLR